jgi:hypothetical protein
VRQPAGFDVKEEAVSTGERGWLQKELPFWCALVIWAFFPTRLTPWWDVLGVPVRSTDLLVFPIAAFYLLAPSHSTPVWRRVQCPGPRVLTCFLGVLSYGAFSMLWSGLGSSEAASMFYTLLSAGASGYLGYALVAGRPAAATRTFLWRLTVFVSVVALVYSVESLFSIGLRSPLAPSAHDFGIERVRGPLFEPSTGFFILLPALTYAVQETLARRVSRPLGWAAILSLTIAILGLGSRGGLVVAGSLLLLLALTSSRRNRLAVVLLSACLVGAWHVVFSKATTKRLFDVDSMKDRWADHLTALDIVSDRSVVVNVFGSGYGSLWPWYVTESAVRGGDLYSMGTYIRYTSHGPLLYHPHSTYLMLCVELGLAGVLFCYVLWRALIRVLARSSRLKRDTIFASGVLVSCFSPFFDLFLVRRPTRDAVWWVFLFGLLALVQRSQRRRAPAMGILVSPPRRSGWSTPR